MARRGKTKRELEEENKRLSEEFGYAAAELKERPTLEEAEQTKQDLARTQEQLGQAKVQLDEKQAEIKALQELHEHEVLSAVSQVEKQALRDDLDSMQSQLEQFQGQVTELEDQKEAFAKGNREFQERVWALEGQAEQFEGQKKNLQERISELETEAEDLKNQIAELEAQKKELEEKLEKLEAANQQLQDQIQPLQGQNRILNDENKDLLVQGTRLDAENQALKAQAQTRDTENQTLRAENQAVNQENERLRNSRNWQNVTTRGGGIILLLLILLLACIGISVLAYLLSRSGAEIDGIRFPTPTATAIPGATPTPRPGATSTPQVGTINSFLSDSRFPKSKQQAADKFGGDEVYWLWEGIQSAGGDVPSNAWQYSGPSITIQVPRDWRVDYYEGSTLHSCGGDSSSGKYGPVDVDASFAVLFFVPGESACPPFTPLDIDR